MKQKIVMKISAIVVETICWHPTSGNQWHRLGNIYPIKYYNDWGVNNVKKTVTMLNMYNIRWEHEVKITETKNSPLWLQLYKKTHRHLEVNKQKTNHNWGKII